MINVSSKVRDTVIGSLSIVFAMLSMVAGQGYHSYVALSLFFLGMRLMPEKFTRSDQLQNARLGLDFGIILFLSIMIGIIIAYEIFGIKHDHR